MDSCGRSGDYHRPIIRCCLLEESDRQAASQPALLRPWSKLVHQAGSPLVTAIEERAIEVTRPSRPEMRASEEDKDVKMKEA